jgi:hexosaminidase
LPSARQNATLKHVPEPNPTDLSQRFEQLFPRPQRLERLGESIEVPRELRLSGSTAQIAPALDWLEAALARDGRRLLRSGSGAPSLAVSLSLEETGLGAEGYVLEIDAARISIRAAEPVGLQCGVATLVQLIAIGRARAGALRLPLLRISDYPDFTVRGVMLDISRDKVPTLSTLRALIDRLAGWKINQLQLYMEHTFAYPGHEAVWQHAGALSGAEVEELDRYAAERHVQLVPNQNSFGHLHRWLVHEPYRALAECPEGFDHPWNWTREPYGLCATDPAALRFLGGLYDELLAHFRSREFNVGLDETIDLGLGRSKLACERRGTEQVYLEFLHAVHGLVRERGHRMQFWADIIVKRPDLVPQLPPDAIALEWGYEADHPFPEHLALFRSRGLDFYVCPGTSSWNSIGGRTENAIRNLARAAEHGKAAGALGYLTTDWGDHGHLQPLSVSYLGLLLGAGFSWNAASARDAGTPGWDVDVPALLDTHVFGADASGLGQVAYDLGNVYRHAGSLRANASVLFWILIQPGRVFTPAGVTRESLEQTLEEIERVGAALSQTRLATSESVLVRAELGWVRDLLAFACRLGMARSESADPAAAAAFSGAARTQLAGELAEFIQRQRSLWLERNRPGGLADSAARLERLLEALRAR